MSTHTSSRDTATSSTQGVAGKYLTFSLGKESYGIQILRVREIIRLADITPVRCMPEYVRGVINLRGKVVPVADLRVKFGLTSIQDGERTCIVVVQLGTDTKPLMGVIVDAVEEVVNLPAADIEPTPDFGVSVDTSYMLGVAKVRGTVKTLLNIDRVISTDVIQEIRTAA
ncbi:MAG TPA: chemotaxis protein CheW [Verrucomicrobiales bacterium]|nr:chemotaxis protein CheW [Verrucomicrobiales bacterium]